MHMRTCGFHRACAIFAALTVHLMLGKPVESVISLISGLSKYSFRKKEAGFCMNLGSYLSKKKGWVGGFYFLQRLLDSIHSPIVFVRLALFFCTCPGLVLL